MVVGGIAASGIVASVAGLIRAGDYWRGYPLVSYLAVYAVMLAAMTAIWARWGGGFERERMRAAAWLLILILGAALSLALPGATIFFLIAPAIALAGIALGSRILVVLAILAQFLMFAELLALIEMLLIDGPLWAVAPLAALAALPALVEVEADGMRRGGAVAAHRRRRPVDRGAGRPPRQRRAPAVIQHRLFPRRRPQDRELGRRDQAGAPARRLPGTIGARASCPTTVAPGGSRPLRW